MLARISRLIAPVFYPAGITDWRLAYAALCGFIAKENVAATVAMLMPAGTGLGLAITKSAVLMHRGVITVTSVEGEGTSFSVKIPLICVAGNGGPVIEKL